MLLPLKSGSTNETPHPKRLDTYVENTRRLRKLLYYIQLSCYFGYLWEERSRFQERGLIIRKKHPNPNKICANLRYASF